jgi:ABC-type transport system involved in multi-copper enzyme maturation permease subunit
VTLVAAELLKLRTTRAPYWLVLVAAAIAAIAAAAQVGSGSLDDDPALSLAQGATFGAMFAAVLGILIVTNEYRHGTVMTTFLAEPRRERVLAAKLAAAVAAGVVFALATAVVTAAIALPWLASRGEALALDGQAAEALVRLVLAFALWSALGAAAGAVIQSQVGAIVAVFVWFLVLESLVGVLSSVLLTDLGEPDPVSPYLPGSVLGGVVGGEFSEFVLGGPAATGLALLYVAGLALLGALSVTRRDP